MISWLFMFSTSIMIIRTILKAVMIVTKLHSPHSWWYFSAPQASLYFFFDVLVQLCLHSSYLLQVHSCQSYF